MSRTPESPRRRPACWAALVLASAALTPVAHAQEPAPVEAPVEASVEGEVEAAPDPDQRARELYLRGDRAYAEGRYDESIALFREAHDLSDRPQLLFNLANAYERAGRLEEAIASLRSYAPHAPAYDADTIARRIRALEERLSASEAPEAESAPTTAPVEPVPPPAPSGNDGALLGAGLVVLGLGVAAGGVGLGLALAARDASTELEDLCVDGLCQADAEDVLARESSMALGADISFAAAGALGVAGLIMTIAGAASGGDEEAAVAVNPLVGPGVGGLHVSARY